MILRRENWQPAPPDLRLTKDEVHVWRASINLDPVTVKTFLPVLVPEERRRAEAYRFDRERLRYVVTRGILRAMLACYLKTSPSSIRLTYSKYGKPALAVEQGGLSFNVSHSHGVALYAFARGREVGVDIELMREDLSNLDLARRFFSVAELHELQLLPVSVRKRAFFNCWTRKEAYVKALGAGLSHPLDSFTVSLTPGEPARLILPNKDPLDDHEWSIIDLNPFQGYAAALVVPECGLKILLWEW